MVMLVGLFLLLVGAVMFGITVVLICLTVVLWLVKTVLGILVWYLERRMARQEQMPVLTITVTIRDEQDDP